MQCGGGYFIVQYKSLFFIVYAYRNRTVGVIVVCFGGNYQVKFFRQRMFVFDFYFIVQLRVGLAVLRFRTGNFVKLFYFFWRIGDVKDEIVGFVANIVINNFQRIDIVFVTRYVDDRIFKCRFVLLCCFVNMLNNLLIVKLFLRDILVGGKCQFRSLELCYFVVTVNLDEIVAWSEIGQLETQRC